MVSSAREVLYIAAGDDACAVAAHLHNLQGLAATDGSCVTNVTHTVSRNSEQQVYQAHALLIPSTTTTQEATTDPVDRAAIDVFRERAASLAYGSHSRYLVPKAETPRPAYRSTGRTVNWDEEDDESDQMDNDDDDKEYQARRQQEWNSMYQPAQDVLDQFWSGSIGPTATTPMEPTTTVETADSSPPETSAADSKKSRLDLDKLCWRNFWMPPNDPDMILPPPCTYFQPESSTPTYSQQIKDPWVQDVLWERVRRQLEACDSCQGTVLFQSNGIGWGTGLLHEWRDECPSKAVLTGHTPETPPQVSSINSEVVRKELQNLLTLQDATELSEVTVPLIPPNTVTEAARLAAAWESASTPFRVSGTKSHIALSSYYTGTDGTVPQLSLREFTRCLQRSHTSRNVLQLSVISDASSVSFYDALLAGTSCERDERMRSSDGRGTPSTTPGAWLNTTESLSSANFKSTLQRPDRSLHYHFTLATSLRPSARRPSIFQNGTAHHTNLTTCLMEGMGIRYRPEQSLAIVVDHSLSELTTNGYGAGSYWKHLQWKSPPVAAVLENSSQAYEGLHHLTSQAQAILAPRGRRQPASLSMYEQLAQVDGFPEYDDMQEALSNMLDLRDAYEPPVGSGLVVQETTSGDMF